MQALARFRVSSSSPASTGGWTETDRSRRALVATGGKPYYLAGLLPALITAGAIQVDGCLQAGRLRLRSGLLVAAIAVSAWSTW